MKTQPSPSTRFVVWPPIEKHGVIGDRRTAALVAADGTVDWWCLPDYDDHVALGALLDPEKGGFCRFGPEKPDLGEQNYEDETACLVTRWIEETSELQLTDFMPHPERKRSEAEKDRRVILRRMKAIGGDARVRFELQPRRTFEEMPWVTSSENGMWFEFAEARIGLWSSFEVESDNHGAGAALTLRSGEEAWVMIGLEENPAGWNVDRCRELHERTKRYWREWIGTLKTFPEADEKLKRCAITVHLLAHAPNDAVVAAVTTSLPERVGGDRNYDYRYTWVRDASLSAAFLAIMGESEEVAHYFTWLSGLSSEVDAPLQVCYRTDGQTRLEEREVEGVTGYRDSLPVHFGNRAYHQRQLGSLGWFADSALIFLDAGGQWKPEFSRLLHRAADHVCRSWHEPESGVWELELEAHYVASKVMAWVTLNRALEISKRLGEETPEMWKMTRDQIRDEVLTKGWSDERGSFRQRYDSVAIDAASLLISLMGFLPADDPRMLGTLDAIERELVIDDLVYRFDPQATLGGDQLPLGEFEGAFLPATFWFAHALAGAGRKERAAEVLHRCETIAAGPGIFSEEADPHRNCLLGNTPLLFSQVEYGRALLALHDL